MLWTQNVHYHDNSPSLTSVLNQMNSVHSDYMGGKCSPHGECDKCIQNIRSRHKSVQLPGYELCDRGSIPGRAGCLSWPQRPDRSWGSPSLLSNGQGFSSGSTRTGRKADYSPQCSAEVKNEWSCTFPHTLSLHGA
jgi:hypothetical protein